MQDNSTTRSITCEAGLCGIRPCRGLVALLWETLDCSCACHEPEPVTADELEAIAEADADRRLDGVIW